MPIDTVPLTETAGAVSLFLTRPDAFTALRCPAPVARRALAGSAATDAV